MFYMRTYIYPDGVKGTSSCDRQELTQTRPISWQWADRNSGELELDAQ